MFLPSWWDDLSVRSDGDRLGRLCTREPVLDTPPKPHLSQVSPSILSFVISSQGKTDFPPRCIQISLFSLQQLFALHQEAKYWGDFSTC